MELQHNHNNAYTRCTECKHNEPREKLVIRIYDITGPLDVTVYGQDARKIMDIDSNIFMQNYSQGYQLPIDHINKLLQDECFYMKIKRNKCRVANITHNQYAVTNLRRIALDANLEPHCPLPKQYKPSYLP